MQREKIALAVLMIIIVGVVLLYFANIGNDTVEEDKKIIEIGDCADVHYIGRYASNDSVFSSSYDFVHNKSGGTPLKVYITDNKTAIPPENYSDYYSGLLSALIMQDYYTFFDEVYSPLGVKDGFITQLLGMQNGQSNKTDIIQANDAFGSYPSIGKKINVNLSEIGIDETVQYTVYNILKNQTIPAEYGLDYEKGDYIILRDESHYIGEEIPYINNTIMYSSWKNCSKVTDIGDTELTIYITPTTDVDEEFTWRYMEVNAADRYSTNTTYPTNTSKIISMNDTTIVVQHTPDINDTITINVYYEDYAYLSEGTYTVVDVTDDKINVSFPIDEEGINLSYQEFDRQTTIQRSHSQNITTSGPAEIIDQQLFSILRLIDKDFITGTSQYADQDIYYEIEVVNVYKTSQES